MGVNDFEPMLSAINPFNIQGISALHGFRITARRDALSSQTGIDVFVTEHFIGGERWHPMPAPANPKASIFRNIFRHPLAPDVHGYAVAVNNYYPVVAKRQRQRYVYEIAYSNGSTYEFNLPCISCPYELSRDHVTQSLLNLKRQRIRESTTKDLLDIYNNICQTLRNRHDEQYIEAHKTFFDSIPKSDGENHISYFNSLKYLFEKYGGDIKFAVKSKILQGPLVIEDGIGPITFNGSLVSYSERRKLLEAEGLYRPLAKRKKKDEKEKFASCEERKTTKNRNIFQTKNTSEFDCGSSDNSSIIISESDSDSESSSTNSDGTVNTYQCSSLKIKY